MLINNKRIKLILRKNYYTFILVNKYNLTVKYKWGRLWESAGNYVKGLTTRKNQ